jgi:hypothetical protein
VLKNTAYLYFHLKLDEMQNKTDEVTSPIASGSGSITQTVMYYVGFEVFTAVVMKSIIFWDMTPCSRLRDIAGCKLKKPNK